MKLVTANENGIIFGCYKPTFRCDLCETSVEIAVEFHACGCGTTKICSTCLEAALKLIPAIEGA